MLLEEINVFLVKAVVGAETIGVALAQEEVGIVPLAKLGRGLRQCIEHRLQVEGRAADHLKHVGDGGLLLQGFGKIVGALAQLVKQARVLDGDHGLGGEVLDEIDLLFGERTHFGAIDRDRTN